MRAFIPCVPGISRQSEDGVGKLLSHRIGDSSVSHQPITLRSALEACGREPVSTAHRLMALPAEVAVQDLSDMLVNFRIDGVRCPEPEKYARKALKRAGLEFGLNPFATDYGHSATALLGIAVLGILLAFPTWML
ncbi:hypothetical protein N825_28055 [Skermanella stibiiresistens SB22]|uniref:Uncharacterized protein n=1 Tax=Skermanella stibiiresistens SB22 TaxID=1385369 RepID=W9H9X7_9PROT|nr:hypothetical protein [Skermanella stibiiresistens]EWY41517.1 hypothetical protein N825_28055 [Skermanella stibiiresistens SB22]